MSVQSTTDDYHLCSGVVLDETYVLTTAVCCEQEDTFLMKVLAGTHDLGKGGQEVISPLADIQLFSAYGSFVVLLLQQVLLESVNVHEDYDAFNLYDNICVMTLDGQLNLGRC